MNTFDKRANDDVGNFSSMKDLFQSKVRRSFGSFSRAKKAPREKRNRSEQNTRQDVKIDEDYKEDKNTIFVSKSQIMPGFVDPEKSYCSETMQYELQVCKGFLKKLPRDQKLWQGQKRYKRYFLLDHSKQEMRIAELPERKKSTARLQIKHYTYEQECLEMDEDKVKIVKYSEFTSVQASNQSTKFELDQNLQIKKQSISNVFSNNQIGGLWSSKFTLTCRDRSYELLARTQDERSYWIFVFQWIIKENSRHYEREVKKDKYRQMFKKLHYFDKQKIVQKQKLILKLKEFKDKDDQQYEEILKEAKTIMDEADIERYLKMDGEQLLELSINKVLSKEQPPQQINGHKTLESTKTERIDKTEQIDKIEERRQPQKTIENEEIKEVKEELEKVDQIKEENQFKILVRREHVQHAKSISVFKMQRPVKAFAENQLDLCQSNSIFATKNNEEQSGEKTNLFESFRQEDKPILALKPNILSKKCRSMRSSINIIRKKKDRNGVISIVSEKCEQGVTFNEAVSNVKQELNNSFSQSASMSVEEAQKRNMNLLKQGLKKSASTIKRYHHVAGRLSIDSHGISESKYRSTINRKLSTKQEE